MILLAELADKSQLTTLAFAARYPPLTVLAAISIAAMLINGVSVVAGIAIASALPTTAIKLAGGILFLGFAAWTLRGGGPTGGEERSAPRTGRWALLTIGTAFILAELGDKTMLATATLAATSAPIPTWLGATAGEVVADGLAIVVGATLAARLPERAIRLAAAAAFVVFGVVLLAEGVGLV